AGREPPCFETVATGEVVRAALEEFRPVAEEKKVTLRLEPLPDLYADRGLLEQIFRRLLSNAITFLSAHRPGEITVGGEIRDREAVCWVKDNGLGIKPQDRQRIFTPFGRVQEIQAPGEGVGLATVRKLVERQGGRVWVESVHNQGSVFHIGLPHRLDGRN
ncbi:MAG: HAMP domain-containing histidine kinase, partial [Acidobacteria bacterium]|nr:HAMP domain-containing histidine kinase [Acidobacteriota bacterium]